MTTSGPNAGQPMKPSTFTELMDRFGARPSPTPGRRDPGFVELGPRFDQALLYAAAAHRQQPRKGTAVPYLSHLLGVASISDKLHNAQAILADLETLGPALWDRFPGKTPEDHLWYYESLAATFADRLPGPLSDRLRRTVEAIGALHRSPPQQ